MRSKTRDERKKNAGSGSRSRESESCKRRCPTKKRRDGAQHRNVLSSRAVKK